MDNLSGEFFTAKLQKKGKITIFARQFLKNGEKNGQASGPQTKKTEEL